MGGEDRGFKKESFEMELVCLAMILSDDRGGESILYDVDVVFVEDSDAPEGEGGMVGEDTALRPPPVSGAGPDGACPKEIG
jgi:hypothetical protein